MLNFNASKTCASQAFSVNADYSLRIAINHHNFPWTTSPALGVMRRMLERHGGELAKATSIVRYEQGSCFSTHRHDLGEEFLVLEGVFEDEWGRYPAGTFVKNPAGSHHSPRSTEGCTLFVKLRRIHEDDSQRVVVYWPTAAWHPGMVAGLEVMPLWSSSSTSTALVRWAPGTRFNPHRHWGGEEIYVIEGVFEDEHGRYPAGTWLRSPHLSEHRPFSKEGCTIFVKTGHLDAPTTQLNQVSLCP